MLSAATILGQGPSALGTTIALLITFLGIGVVVNALIVYIVGQVLVERKQNRERMREYSSE
jgi:hypothetical protein